MLRREIFKLLALVGFVRPVGVLASAPHRPYVVPPTMWYENEQGEKWIPPQPVQDFPTPPQGFVYCWFRFGRQVDETCYRDNKQIVSGGSTWSEDLVLALATRGGYRLHDAILIAATMCEGCMNVAAYDYGLPWGYANNSEQHRRVGTSCQHCTLAHADQEAT